MSKALSLSNVEKGQRSDELVDTRSAIDVRPPRKITRFAFLSLLILAVLLASVLYSGVSLSDHIAPMFLTQRTSSIIGSE